MSNSFDLSDAFGDVPEPTRPVQRVEPPKPERPAQQPQSGDLPKATVQFNTRLTIDARAKLESDANRTGMTRQEIVNDALMKWRG